MWNDRVSQQHCPNPKLKYDQYVIKETSSHCRRLRSSVLVAAALAAAALRIAAHEVWHLAFTFFLVMELDLPFSSSPLLHGDLCLGCTKHNGEKRWLWNSCFWFLLPSDCLRSVVKESWLLPLKWLSVLCSLTRIIHYWHFVCSSPSC